MTEAELAQLMQGMTEQQKALFLSRYNAEKKDRALALILSILFGPFGVDRFYVGDMLAGALKLITFGGFLIWYIIDFFLIMGRADDYNRRKANEIASIIKIS
jgi:TM2 domain-containing membrane protein YozV